MAAALQGLKVVEWGEFIAAPYSGKLLADMGAEVIKVERPGVGDVSRHHGPFTSDGPNPEASGLFLYLNGNKLGVTLDVAQPPGLALLRELLQGTDLFITSYPPSLVEQSGLDYQSLKADYPRLIVATITPYGWTGPYRHFQGYDINVCALGGVTFSVGEEGREPLTPPYQQGDYQAALSAVGGSLTALLARGVSGQGQHVDIAASEVWATVHSGGAVTTYLYQGVTGHRAGRRRRDLYPYTLLQCKDGQMCLIARDGYQWKRFLVEVMGREDLANNPRYRDRRVLAEEYPEEMDRELLPWLEQHTREEVFRLCLEHHIPFAPVRRVDEVATDPHLAARQFFATVEHPVAGPVQQPGAPYKFSATPWRLDRPAPLLGQHNRKIFGDRLKHSPGELDNLAQAGVI
jgi:crotonobetainyl-CoA:carnitine CoA-transferase CaiB-like acyl-CoA transferase